MVERKEQIKEMELHLKRTPNGAFTTGVLTIEGRPEKFPTIEDEVRPNGKKIPGLTAIPAGRYRMTLGVKSPKFSRYEFYMEVCGGFLPRLLGVENFDGVLVHCGRTEQQSSGCIILNDYNAPLERSKDYFRQFYSIIKPHGNNLWITIE